jgi:hypothetical protein
MASVIRPEVPPRNGNTPVAISYSTMPKENRSRSSPRTCSGDVYATDELYVFGFVDHTHTPAAELFDDAIVRDGLPNELGRSRHCRES